MVLQDVEPACESDLATGYLSDGITAYIVTRNPSQAEEVCQVIGQKAVVKRQILSTNKEKFFDGVASFVTH